MNFTNLVKSLIFAVFNVLTIIGMSIICSDFKLGDWTNAVIIAAGIYIANIIIWPIISKFLMKFIIITFGIGAYILNSVIFYGIAYYIPGVHVGINAFLQIPLATAIVTTLLSDILNIDYYENFIRNLVNSLKKQEIKLITNSKGVIILEIDGLSIDILKKAVDRGFMPTVKKWIETTHTLKKWETDLSSQTGASQAGILHGNNKGIIAYRWVEKENNNRIMVSGKLSDAPIIEKRISDGNGLLCDKGVSITNMFTGDSPNPILTSSRFKILSNMYNKSLEVIFMETYTFQRIIILFLWEILVEIKSQITHKIKNIQPRLRRGLVYATIRAGANVLLREVATETLINHMVKGDINSAYVSYVGYDEVAHHSGIDDEDVWNVLKNIDRQLNNLKKTEKLCEKNYEFVILSDHGQSSGPTFKQKYGITLANYVRRLLPENMKIYENTDHIQNHFRDAYIPQNKQIESILEKVDDIKNTEFFTENEQIKNLRNLIMDNMEEIGRKYNDNLDYIKKHESREMTTKKAKDSELIVLGSGNLGLIYLTQWKKRLKYEEIVTMFPNLLPGLVKHSGIAFILVDSYENGPMAISSDGIYYLNSDKIVGKNPIENFGENAELHLKRHNSFKHMPDILVNSYYNPKTGEVYAFEELIGNHGGLGGGQTRPFILYPSKWEAPEELVGAKSIYNFLKKEINELNNS